MGRWEGGRVEWWEGGRVGGLMSAEREQETKSRGIVAERTA